MKLTCKLIVCCFIAITTTINADKLENTNYYNDLLSSDFTISKLNPRTARPHILVPSVDSSGFTISQGDEDGSRPIIIIIPHGSQGQEGQGGQGGQGQFSFGPSHF